MQGQQESQLGSNVENKLNFSLLLISESKNQVNATMLPEKLLQWQYPLKVSLWKHERFLYNCVQ